MREKRKTIHDYFVKFEQHCFRVLSDKGAKRVTRACYCLFEKFREKKYPEEFFTQDIQDLLDILTQEGKTDGIVRTVKHSLKGFWDWMMDYVPDEVAYNPAAGCRPIKRTSKRASVGRVWILAENEIPKLFEAIKTPADRLIVLGGLVGGLTIAELSQLGADSLSSDNVLTLPTRNIKLREDVADAIRNCYPVPGLYSIRGRWNNLLRRAGMQPTPHKVLRRLLALTLQRYGCGTADVLAYLGCPQSPQVRTLLEPESPVPILEVLEKLPRG